MSCRGGLFAVSMFPVRTPCLLKVLHVLADRRYTDWSILSSKDVIAVWILPKIRLHGMDTPLGMKSLVLSELWEKIM